MFWENRFGENKGGGEKSAAAAASPTRSGTSSPAGPKLKTHKPKLKTKVRIHMKKNILSFNKMQTWHYVTHKQLHE